MTVLRLSGNFWRDSLTLVGGAVMRVIPDAWMGVAGGMCLFLVPFAACVAGTCFSDLTIVK
jgi:hypothetical protein